MLTEISAVTVVSFSKVAAGSLVGLTVYVGASIRYLNDLLRELLHPVVPLSPRTFAISAGLSAATIVSGTIGLFVYIYHSKSRIKNALLSTLDEETRKTLIGIEGTLEKIQRRLDQENDESGAVGGFEPRFPLLLNIALEGRLQHHHPSVRALEKHKLCDDKEVSVQALYWMRFASAAYGFTFCKALGLLGGLRDGLGLEDLHP